jgi:hypothetical protein
MIISRPVAPKMASSYGFPAMPIAWFVQREQLNCGCEIVDRRYT